LKGQKKYFCLPEHFLATYHTKEPFLNEEEKIYEKEYTVLKGEK